MKKIQDTGWGGGQSVSEGYVCVLRVGAMDYSVPLHAPAILPSTGREQPPRPQMLGSASGGPRLWGTSGHVTYLRLWSPQASFQFPKLGNRDEFPALLDKWVAVSYSRLPGCSLRPGGTMGGCSLPLF